MQRRVCIFKTFKIKVLTRSDIVIIIIKTVEMKVMNLILERRLFNENKSNQTSRSK